MEELPESIEYQEPSSETYGSVEIPEDDDDEDEEEGVVAEAEEEEEEKGLLQQQQPRRRMRKFKFSWKKLWAFAGPGLLMSIAYLDPGNLESDLQAGATTRYSLLWVLLLSTCFGGLLQVLAARLGVVTGHHLAEMCRAQYPRPVSMVLWIMTELAVCGSDIQEVIGSALAIYLLTGVHIWVGVLLTALDTFLFLLLEQWGIRRLEFFFSVLIAMMAVSFGIEYGISAPPQLDVFLGCVWPRLNGQDLQQAIGLIGAVIMPHNLYLHSALVQSRKIDRRCPDAVHEANVYNAIESAGALLVSFVINLFVVSVFANAFYGQPGADKIGLQQAGCKLEQEYGTVAKYVWGVGLLAAGQSSTMTGTYAGQFVMQGFLNLQWKPWRRTLVTRSIAIVPSVLVAFFLTSYLDRLNQWLNVLQSVQLPFALIPLLAFTSTRSIMGPFTNNVYFTCFIWLFGLLVISLNIQLVVSSAGAGGGGGLVAVYVVGFFYCLFLLWLVWVWFRAQPVWSKLKLFFCGLGPNSVVVNVSK